MSEKPAAQGFRIWLSQRQPPRTAPFGSVPFGQAKL